MTRRAINLHSDRQSMGRQTYGDADARQTRSACGNSVLGKGQITDFLTCDRELRLVFDQRGGARRRWKENRFGPAVGEHLAESVLKFRAIDR